VSDQRPASVADLHEIAAGLPGTILVRGSSENPIYQVGRKSFVFFRNPRPDAVDPSTGERYDDVIVVWVESEAEKRYLLQDRTLLFFTTSHFDGHPSVLVRASRLGEMSRSALAELIEGAWLSRASPARARAWLAAGKRS
jgi:hypothetical protein